MKRNKIFFTLREKPNGSVLWKGTLVQPQGRNLFRIENGKDNIVLEIQKRFTDTTHSTNTLNDTDKLSVNIRLKSPSFYPTKHKKGGEFESARIRVFKNDFPKAIGKLLNPSSSIPLFEIDDADDALQVEVKKIFIPFNIIDIRTKLEILL